jgi:hypothetical protein
MAERFPDTTKGCRPNPGAADGSWHMLSPAGEKSSLWLWRGGGWRVGDNNPFGTSPGRMGALGWTYDRPADTERADAH